MTTAALDLDFLRGTAVPNWTPRKWNEVFLPHYGFGRTPGADFHRTLSADLHRLHTRRGVGLAYVAPRGGAKSTWLTLAYPLRCALERWEPHILLLSDSDDQAALYLGQIKAELEGNPRLAEVYPEATGMGPEWSTQRARLPNGVVIEALGRGTRIRGRRNRSARPSLVVVDDVQSNRDVVSPVERERAWLWFTREVIPAGDERTNFLSVGSALHRQAVAVRAAELPGWLGRTFRAVHRWPGRMDLWDQCERVATNLADEDRVEAGRRFYEERRDEMDRDALVYWREKWGIYELMMKRAAIGRAAFESEYQGYPLSGENVEWPPEYFDGILIDRWPAGVVLTVQALDPSKGLRDRPGDDQAHVRLGLIGDGPLKGHLAVECVLRREPDYVGAMLDLARQWKPDMAVVEENATMGLLVPEIDRQVREREAAGVPQQFRYRPKHWTVPKVSRIRMFTGGYLSRRQLHVLDTPGGRALVDQWKDFPLGEHDDAADACASAIWLHDDILAGNAR